MTRVPAANAGIVAIFLLATILALPLREAGSRGAVCLFDSTDINVKNNLTAKIKYHRSFEITSEGGTRYAQVIIPINDYVAVRNVKGYTRLPGGKKIALTKQDIGTTSSPGFGGSSGLQAVMFSLRTPTPGSIIYYEYELAIKSLLYLPHITRRNDCATNRFAVNLHWGKKVGIRYDTEGVMEEPYEDGILFKAENLSEFPGEPESCPERLHVSLSSDMFAYGKAKFLSRSWTDVGRFYSKLSIQPDNVEAELLELAGRLAANSLTRDDTLNSFFEFLADSVSYVALQMGKGDFTPHNCSAILKRRFGDCKDQAALLSSLCRAAGIEAYPALINTGEYPEVDSLWPWPAWFDHAVTVVPSPAGDRILDPSDRLGSTDYLPPRLRGKFYLVCDGRSGLSKAPFGPVPAFGVFWQFVLSKPTAKGLEVEFLIRHLNDAAALFRGLWLGSDTTEIKALTLYRLKSSGWNPQELIVDNIVGAGDSLVVAGRFTIDLSGIGDSRSLAIASPLNSHLLDSIFPEVRRGDYCRDGSLRLEETVIIDLAIPDLQIGTEYNDSWSRQNLSFKDAMVIDHGRAIYHRLFNYDGGSLIAPDYNAFRDFLLSRKDQQYVRFQK